MPRFCSKKFSLNRPSRPPFHTLHCNTSWLLYLERHSFWNWFRDRGKFVKTKLSGFSQTSFDIFSIVTLIKPVRYMIPASFTQYDAILFVLKQTSNKEYSNQPDDFCATIRCQFHRTLFSPCPTCQKCDHKWFIMFYIFFPSKVYKKSL